jgi:DNA-binding transcriptional regulator YiaG
MTSNQCYIHPAQTELMVTMSLSTQMTPKDIARITNYSEQTVQQWSSDDQAMVECRNGKESGAQM